MKLLLGNHDTLKHLIKIMPSSSSFDKIIRQDPLPSNNKYFICQKVDTSTVLNRAEIQTNILRGCFMIDSNIFPSNVIITVNGVIASNEDYCLIEMDDRLYLLYWVEGKNVVLSNEKQVKISCDFSTASSIWYIGMVM